MTEISEAAKEKRRQRVEAQGPNTGGIGYINAVHAAFDRFIQEVSDAAKEAKQASQLYSTIAPFILSEPVDPLTESLREAYGAAAPEFVEATRQALAKRGFQIVEAA